VFLRWTCFLLHGFDAHSKAAPQDDNLLYNVVSGDSILGSADCSLTKLLLLCKHSRISQSKVRTRDPHALALLQQGTSYCSATLASLGSCSAAPPLILPSLKAMHLSPYSSEHGRSLSTENLVSLGKPGQGSFSCSCHHTLRRSPEVYLSES
jgi:hypothetical protein